MAKIVATPKHPTHAVRHIDNWDGEGDTKTSLAFIDNDIFYCIESGEPLLRYARDEVLQVWELK